MQLTKRELRAALVERHGEDVQKKIDAARVGIAGLGGLGSNIAVHLARMGVGNLVLVDFDTVDTTNLNRQHYTMKDLGSFKTEALLAQLQEINPYLSYEIHTERVVPENVGALFSSCDVICEAFDRADQKAMLISTVLHEMPHMNLVSGNGMAGCGSANEIQVRHKFGKLYVCGDESSDVAQGLGLMAPRVAVCAAHEATAIMRLILGLTP